MTLDADRLADRRRLKRRVSLWRIAAILAVAFAILAYASRDQGMLAALGVQPHIARVNIEGFISDSREQRKLLAELEKSNTVRGVILYINSPGGTTAGAEGLYNALRRLAEKKPVAAVFGTVATSAAYLAGIAADHVVARGNSITGSVGVILQYAEVSELLKTLGVRVEEIRSGPLKAVPSPFTPPDPAGRNLAEEMVNESRDWFVNLVTQRRMLATPALEEVRTGRIYTGRQALDVGLVDVIGDEETAKTWMQSKGVPGELEVIEWKPKESGAEFLFRSFSGSISALAGWAVALIQTIVTEGALRLNHLDGLVSLWHPQNNK
jgi:protease-4